MQDFVDATCQAENSAILIETITISNAIISNEVEVETKLEEIPS